MFRLRDRNRLRYRYWHWTLLSFPDTEIWSRSYTTRSDISCLHVNWSHVTNHIKNKLKHLIVYEKMRTCVWASFIFILHIKEYQTVYTKKYNVMMENTDYGLPMKSFSLKSRTFGFGQTNWTDKFWGIWVIFGLFISTHFGTVSPLYMFSINQPLFLQKTKSLYPNPKYLFEIVIWIWIWAAKS